MEILSLLNIKFKLKILKFSVKIYCSLLKKCYDALLQLLVILMNKSSVVLNFIKENSIEFINFRFSDLFGEQKQISRTVSSVNENLLNFGVTIDGSSIRGWKVIDNSDILLKPDLDSFYIEQYTKHKTLNITCDIIDTVNDQNYLNDPRSIAKKAEGILSELGIADKAFFGPELEFFIFNNVSYSTCMMNNFFKIDADEAHELTKESHNVGFRAKRKGCYDSVAPLDRYCDLRTDILMDLAKIDGMNPSIHHHEVGNDQCEIGFQYGTLVRAADKLQIAKHIIKNTVYNSGQVCTFMPKPFKSDAGSGMHVHISLLKDGENLFHGDSYHNLSELALYFIGGIGKHIKSLCAFTNPTTNSYKRLKPGFEAPVVMSYSAKNRSTAIRIPYSNKSAKNETRFECRFPDPSANPYLTFAAILMAGIDGIVNKIHPGDATDFDLFSLKKEETKNYNMLPKSLGEALDALDEDREFLKRGNVFSDSIIDSFLNLKYTESNDISSYPTAAEFENYFNC